MRKKKDLWFILILIKNILMCKQIKIFVSIVVNFV